MINLTQLLIFELGGCNLGHLHQKCPSRLLQSGNRVLDDERIIEVAKEAYNILGFTGLIGWHFYNEPTLQWGRMIKLMRRIKELIPNSKFLLCTNGTILPALLKEACLFDRVLISDYLSKGMDFYYQFYPVSRCISRRSYILVFDERLTHYTEPSTSPCLRPFVEFIINNFGDAYLCCQDWRKEVEIGNILDDDLGTLDARKWEIVKTIYKGMGDNSPNTCLRCNGKASGIPNHDLSTVSRAWKFIDIPKIPKNQIRAVFFDRDGVLNRAIIKNGKPCSPSNMDELEIPEDVLLALQTLKNTGFLLIGITNQPDVSRGLQKREVVDLINNSILAINPLDEIFVCYHDDGDN
jgi:hypothetical protein